MLSRACPCEALRTNRALNFSTPGTVTVPGILKHDHWGVIEEDLR